MPEEVAFEPFMQRAKPVDFDLARNLRMSFAGALIENVSFVSVTQQFNTTTSMAEH